MLRLIPISEIQIAPNRQRKEFRLEEIFELSESIKANSLLHAPILRVEGEGYVLVAGERRLRAIQNIYDLGGVFTYDGQQIATGMVPHTLLSELSPLAAEEAELEENIRRVDLTWQEKASAHSRLANLRTAQATLAGTVPPNVAEISKEVRGSAEGIHHETTRRELIVSKHLADPEVAAAKSVDEAFKILRKKEEREKSRVLGEVVGRTFTAEAHTALNTDSLKWMAECPVEQFDVILTDPPYGMGADEFGDSGGLAAGAHGYKDDAENFLRIMEELPYLTFRVAKPLAHLYVFCDIGWHQLMREKFAEAGWWVFRTPMIWYKKSGMRAPWPESGPQRKYETLLYAVKGKRSVKHMLGDVLDYSPDTNLGHAAQKPVALFSDLLRRSVNPGDSVLDPFAGSGTIFPAAHEHKCRATGIEMDTASYGIGLKRLEQLKALKELGI